MAGPRTCYNAGGAPTNGSGTSEPTFAVFCVPTPTPTQAPTPTPAPASALGSPKRYMDKDLQRTTKLVLELFVKGQEHGQLQANSAPCKQPLKA